METSRKPTEALVDLQKPSKNPLGPRGFCLDDLQKPPSFTLWSFFVFRCRAWVAEVNFGFAESKVREALSAIGRLGVMI